MKYILSTPRARQLTAITLILAATIRLASADNPFAEIIRKTDALTPEQEQKKFRLPPGFEIELVAAEPDIEKPINMAFDEKGRLWVSMSREYPFPAPEGKPPRDAIKILSDFDKTGRAKKITTFADGLNIPIGIYPYKDGALGYSIPYIYEFHDTNHDGHADVKTPLLGEFGFKKDTHGMTSSFRRGYDGWLYANHGFNNDSVLTAKDGSSIKMNSGNTYRVRVDGSHVEQFTWGRVNPFGMIFDPLGNIYSADCETLPIYELLRGAYYPSFGKPSDGLGFAPPMMDHKHGSTAIAGVVYYAATNFPSEFRDNVFVGNVMTCRIDRDSLDMRGSSPWAHEEPDFLATDDPWFRPVDMQMGPDGAIYVADFYNRIIGHYEVALDNPGRDRERGRIWRITYRGTNSLPNKPTPSPEHYDISRHSASALIADLGSENFTIRMLATSQLTDRIGKAAIKPVQKMMANKKSSIYQRIHGMWVLYRLEALDPQVLTAMAQDPDYRPRVHAMRVYSEMATLTDAQHAQVVTALRDPQALVVRCAADALGQHPQFENVRPLLDAREQTQGDDTHLLHVERIALRNQLLATNTLVRLPLASWTEADDRAIADVCLGTPTAESATFLLRHLRKYEETPEVASDDLRHITRYLPKEQMGDLIDLVRKKFKDNMDLQLTLFKSVEEGEAQRGVVGSDSLRVWGAELAVRMADSVEHEDQSWHNTAVENAKDPANPWTIEKRDSQDGKDKIPFISSRVISETRTGILRSKAFAAPAKLGFWMAGHNGSPDNPDQKKNAIRLRAVDSGAILAESFPPRNDKAQHFQWDLTVAKGQQAYLEIVDDDDAGAYAWIAVGRFNPEVVPMSTVDPHLTDERKLAVAQNAKNFKVMELEPQLTRWLADRGTDTDAREAAALALGTINADAHVELMGTIARDGTETAALREKMANALARANTDAARTELIKSLQAAPDRLQVKMALALASTKEGAEILLQEAEQNKVSHRLLLERSLQERFSATKPERHEERIAVLTKGLPPADEQRQKILDQRRKDFDPLKANAELGAVVFQKTCTVCHSMDNKGGAVGPHLDGVGARGLERLIEDVLDPSRNVDPSFRYSTIALKNGDVVSGLFRREEGATLVFVDATGKETPIPKADIVQRVESNSSLMPDNFADALPLADFNNLMAFLLSKGGGAQAKK